MRNLTSQMKRIPRSSSSIGTLSPSPNAAAFSRVCYAVKRHFVVRDLCVFKGIFLIVLYGMFCTVWYASSSTIVRFMHYVGA